MVERDVFTRPRFPVCKTTGSSAADERITHQQSACKMPHRPGPVEIANQTGCSIVECSTDEPCCEQSGCLGVWSGRGLPCPSSLLALAVPGLPALLVFFISGHSLQAVLQGNHDLVASKRVQATDRHFATLCLALSSPLGSSQHAVQKV